MAGIIAGKDDGAASFAGNPSDFVGMAPTPGSSTSRSVTPTAQTDVSQAIAGHRLGGPERPQQRPEHPRAEHQVRHRRRPGLPVDPLTYAVEAAWRAGIVVVVAAGNDGDSTARLSDPAYDPYVIAVGQRRTATARPTADDTVSTFSNSGDGTRNPDVVAPGDHVVSLRDPGCYLDTAYPAARIGDRLFRGSGTSQAAAVVSRVRRRCCCRSARA